MSVQLCPLPFHQGGTIMKNRGFLPILMSVVTSVLVLSLAPQSIAQDFGVDKDDVSAASTTCA
jgi:hypothetical protein